MMNYNFEDDDTGILDEMEEFRQKKKTVTSILNKKKLTKYEMDDFFIAN
jgi:hypothetical protein